MDFIDHMRVIAEHPDKPTDCWQRYTFLRKFPEVVHSSEENENLEANELTASSIDNISFTVNSMKSDLRNPVSNAVFTRNFKILKWFMLIDEKTVIVVKSFDYLPITGEFRIFSREGSITFPYEDTYMGEIPTIRGFLKDPDVVSGIEFADSVAWGFDVVPALHRSLWIEQVK